MPTIPKTTAKTLSTGDMQDVVNIVRQSASPFYQANVPLATNSTEIQKIGRALMAYDSLAQEFMTILWGRIAKVVITSKLFRNPLGFLKKGEVALGEVIEEAFINPAKPLVYDDASIPDEAVARRAESELLGTFHVLNYQIYYKTTIQNDNLKNYFLSWEGVESLISKMTESIYNGAYYDEFQMTKYLIAYKLLRGEMKTMNIGDWRNNPSDSVVAIKGLSNQMTFMSSEYNEAGVLTYTNKDEQFFLVASDFDAKESVEVMASAFNLDKVQFMGQRVLVDGFDHLDIDRLNMLCKDDPNYTPISQAELTQLKNVAGVIIDQYYTQIYDNLNKFTEFYNGEKLFWNYFLHVWRTFSVSPFSNAVALVDGEAEITSVTVSPSAVSLTPGQGVKLTADVQGTNFASNGVVWSSSSEDVTVGTNGYVLAKGNAQAGTVTITATSKEDPTKSGTSTITITG